MQVNNRQDTKLLQVYVRDPYRLLHNIGLPNHPVIEQIVLQNGLQNYRVPEAAGAVSYLDATLSDWNLAGKLTVGIEIPFNDSWSVVANGSYNRLLTNFDAIEDDYLLQSHAPTAAPPYLAEAYNLPPELTQPIPATYTYDKEDSGVFSILAGLRFNLGK